MAEDEKLKSHDFWLTACGFDTYQRNSNYARLDTPWNAFTIDESALVCALWSDLIASVRDPDTGRTRRFVRLGGKLRRWKGVAKKHGEEARMNLERAVADRIPVFGYEAEPHPGLLEAGERKVKHFYLNRVTQLRGWVGLRLDTLKERLDIEGAFDRQGIERDDHPLIAPTLFELVETTAEIPAYRQSPRSAAATVNADGDEGARDRGDELVRAAKFDFLRRRFRAVDRVPLYVLSSGSYAGRERRFPRSVRQAAQPREYKQYGSKPQTDNGTQQPA